MTRNNISLFSLNCRGLSAHWDSFKLLVSEMETEKVCLDVIALSEIWRFPDTTSFKLEGFSPMKHKLRPENDDVKGGVGIFVRENFTFHERSDISVFIPHVCETIFIEIEMPNTKNIVIGSLYRPNTAPKADMDIFMSSLSDIVDIINQENKEIILLGDFNIDLLKFEKHEKTNCFLNDIISQGLFPIITKPTRITEHSATLIDHIHTNITSKEVTSGIVITDLADHFGCFCVLSDRIKNRSNQIKTVRSFSQQNVDYFNELLLQSDYTGILSSLCVDDCYDKFLEMYQTAYETAFPIKTIRIKSKYTRKEPWISQGLLVSSRHKNKLLHKKLKKPTVQNIEKYKKYSNLFSKLCRLSKQLYMTNKLHAYQNDIKKTWSLLNDMIHKSKTTKMLPTKFIIGNTQITDDEEIAKEFNKFFTNVAKNQTEKIFKPITSYNRHLTKHYCNSFFMVPVTPEEVISVARSLKPKVSQGADNISSKLMKLSITAISEPLTHIINLSFTSGVVPKNMKLAKIIPIYKNGNEQLFNNYRPISILPAFSKLLEKVMHQRLYSFLEKNDILNVHQYGFKKKNCTIHPVIHFLKDIVQNNDKPTKDVTIGVFLDLSKAFDTVSHTILLRKLNYYGLRGLAYSWFESYLTGRRQYTTFKSCNSPCANTEYGVPQGSILGPLLFLIYINDLPSVTRLNVLSYADDTTIYVSGDTIGNLFDLINNEIQKIYIWLCENMLSLNIKKTKYMIFSPKGTKIDDFQNTVKINGENIERTGSSCATTSVKFLGIHIDDTLTWKIHIDKLYKTIARSLYALNKVKHFLPTAALRSLYFALVHSHLTYGIIIWGNGKSVYKLFNLQKRAMRIITNKSYRAHTEPLFSALKIPKVMDLYKIHGSIFAHDYVNNHLPDSFQSLYRDPRNVHVGTRQNAQSYLYTTRPRTNFSKSSVYHMIASIWNGLSNELKTETNRNSFKRKIKFSIISNYNEIVNCSNPHCRDCR